ncbi:MAG: spore cortex biosynthesis protein YabQ [Bacilli bacterium]
MILSEQVLSFVFCFVVGFIYHFLFYKLRNYLIYSKYKILLNGLFNFIIFITFFVGIVSINSGILHVYFLLFFILGFCLSKGIFRHL